MNQEQEKMLDIIEALLPQHTIACIAAGNGMWNFLKDKNGDNLITPESCKCCSLYKEARMLLSAHRKSFKGYSSEV